MILEFFRRWWDASVLEALSLGGLDYLALALLGWYNRRIGSLHAERNALSWSGATARATDALSEVKLEHCSVTGNDRCEGVRAP